ncbi:hypothetical protein [Azoarcus indigens]|nr:hypothetical protein [Azoarcus indigens]
MKLCRRELSRRAAASITAFATIHHSMKKSWAVVKRHEDLTP